MNVCWYFFYQNFALKSYFSPGVYKSDLSLECYWKMLLPILVKWVGPMWPLSACRVSAYHMGAALYQNGIFDTGREDLKIKSEMAWSRFWTIMESILLLVSWRYLKTQTFHCNCQSNWKNILWRAAWPCYYMVIPSSFASHEKWAKTYVTSFPPAQFLLLGRTSSTVKLYMI